jgi:hypothetical protein
VGLAASSSKVRESLLNSGLVLIHLFSWTWIYGSRPTHPGGPHARHKVTQTGQAYFLDLNFYARESDGSISRNGIAMPFECSVGALTTTTTDKARVTMLHNPTTGHDDLMLICGSGLYHLAGESDYRLKLLSQDQSLKTSSFVHVSQNGNDVRLWSASDNEHAYLGYTRFSFNDLSSAPDSGMGLQLVPFTDSHEDAIAYRALCTSSNGAFDQHFLRLSKDAVVDVGSYRVTYLNKLKLTRRLGCESKPADGSLVKVSIFFHCPSHQQVHRSQELYHPSGL